MVARVLNEHTSWVLHEKELQLNLRYVEMTEMHAFPEQRKLQINRLVLIL